MPLKRDLLAQFSREELVSIVDQFELDAPNRRKKDDLIDVMASSKRATVAEILPNLSRDRLKELCRAFDLDDSGKDKATIVQRLIGTGSPSNKPSEAKVRANTVEENAAPSERHHRLEPTRDRTSQASIIGEEVAAQVQIPTGRPREGNRDSAQASGAFG